MLQYLYEIIYQHDGKKAWTCAQATCKAEAIAKLELSEAGNFIEVLSVEKTSVADCSALIQ